MWWWREGVACGGGHCTDSYHRGQRGHRGFIVNCQVASDVVVAGVGGCVGAGTVQIFTTEDSEVS